MCPPSSMEEVKYWVSFLSLNILDTSLSISSLLFLLQVIMIKYGQRGLVLFNEQSRFKPRLFIFDNASLISRIFLSSLAVNEIIKTSLAPRLFMKQKKCYIFLGALTPKSFRPFCSTILTSSIKIYLLMSTATSSLLSSRILW